RYREKLATFRLDTIPQYKSRLQSRIYRFLVARQHRRSSQTRLVDLVRQHSRRVLFGADKKPLQQAKEADSRLLGKAESRDGGIGAVTKKGSKKTMTSRYGYGYGASGGAGAGAGGGGYGYGAGGDALPPREPGTRRKKLAAMAGSVYRVGVAAASEIKEQYNNTRIRGVEGSDNQISIPGSFPSVAIVTKGEEQMVLFPSYAKRHIKQNRGHWPPNAPESLSAPQMGMDEEEYWRHEWARLEDEKAVVDVDVRGWIYMPSKGPMTRRNRMLIGLARRLSGIPAPYAQGAEQAPASIHEEHERRREERRIAKEAQEIERKGKGEEEIANRGGYSEQPKDDTDSDTETGNHGGGAGARTSASPPGSPVLAGRNPLPPTSEMTEAELAVANANLMARIGPFMTTPLVQLPITIFFYNEDQSQSRTITTNDSGHFTIRAALDFVPTHVRVLANENISAVEPIQIIETRGVSLISDIDDTIKRSNIHLGAREIFRNTFIRDLADLTIDGVQEWYRGLSEMGVKVHYCSNSPWQLFPVLATYFLIAGLPQGTIHLKHYSGMLQGIFEPVAERKKGTLERILRDFPERKFLLVGDSGEADLEVYTELAVANPDRILAVFIRDVTTPDQVGYFDSSFNVNPSQHARREDTRSRFDELPAADNGTKRPSLPPRVQTAPSNTGPAMGTLIDLTDEPEQTGTSQLKATASNVDLLSRKPPPPRPAKPPALRSAPSDLGGAGVSSRGGRPAMPPNPRTPRPPGTNNGGSSPSSSNGSRPTPPPPPPRRRVTSSLTNAGSEAGGWDAVPAAAMLGHPGVTDGGMVQNSAGEPFNKKVDLWRRRLARAHELLDGQGVKLYTWRRGQDVTREAEGIVREATRQWR
ncbi:hypothetical protein B0H67DRAFT_491820, partial [Lasiosphaeris hirsuta]